MLRLALSLWLAAAAPALAAPAPPGEGPPPWLAALLGVAILGGAGYAIKRFLDGFKDERR